MSHPELSSVNIHLSKGDVGRLAKLIHQQHLTVSSRVVAAGGAMSCVCVCVCVCLDVSRQKLCLHFQKSVVVLPVLHLLM